MPPEGPLPARLSAISGGRPAAAVPRSRISPWPFRHAHLPGRDRGHRDIATAKVMHVVLPRTQGMHSNARQEQGFSLYRRVSALQ